MRRYLALIVIVNIAICSYGQSAKKAVFVIVDGIAADVIEKQPTPFLDAIA